MIPSERNTSTTDELRRRLQESEAIAAISHALSTTLDLGQLLQLIVSAAQRIIPRAEWATIHLLDAESNKLILRASSGLQVGQTAYNIPSGQGIAGRVLMHGETLNVPDVAADARRLPIDSELQARALLVAPVESRHSRVGVISVQNSTPSNFTRSDEKLLKVLGVQAGMAIENARLYLEQQEARQLAEKRSLQLQHLAKRVLTVQETERERIARELHDESGQSLTALKIGLELVKLSLEDDQNEVKAQLGDLIELTDKTMTNLRRLSHNLRPPGLNHYGLHVALEGLCNEFQQHTGLKAIYQGQSVPNLSTDNALVLYRVVQEGLTNVAKHANAKTVTVNLRLKDNALQLELIDDGDGFNFSTATEITPSSGAGLMGMRERLDLINGRLYIDSAPDKGSQITAVVPYTEEP